MRKAVPVFATCFWMTMAIVMAVGGAGGQEQSEQPPETEVVVPTGVRTVYLIRHGAYDHADERDPKVGKELVPLGIAQSRLLASRLRALPDDMTSLHSSTMTRARQTAMVIGEDFPELNMAISDLISECTPPNRDAATMSRHPQASFDNCANRLERAYATYIKPSPDADSHDIVVCHGNVIRYLVTRVLGVDPTAWLSMSIGNCSLTVVKILPEGTPVLCSFSDVGHLPPTMQTQTYPPGERPLVIPGGD